MTAKEIADEYIGLIPTPDGNWEDIRQELADKIDAYAQQQLAPLLAEQNRRKEKDDEDDSYHGYRPKQ